METVIFDGEDGTELEFGILEQTRVGGVNYLLVIDPEENDEENGSAAYILKDISEDGDERKIENHSIGRTGTDWNEHHSL